MEHPGHTSHRGMRVPGIAGVERGIRQMKGFPRSIAILRRYRQTIFGIILIFVIGSTTLSEIRKFQGTDWSSLEQVNNNMCVDGQVNITALGKYAAAFSQSPSFDHFCDTPFGHQHFLWVILDSVPIDLMKPWMDKQSNLFFYRLRNIGDPYSRPIYTTWYTGTVSSNFAGEEIALDNTIDQWRRNSGLPIDYVGPKPPSIDLLGQSRFDYVNLQPNNRDSPHPFEWIYEHELMENPPLDSNGLAANNQPELLEERTFEYLDKHLERDASAIWAVGLFDKMGHTFGNKIVAREHDSVKAVATETFYVLDAIQKWQMSHPEYLLMVSSDHGLPDDGSRIHGAFDGGNEPFFLFMHETLNECTNSGDWIDQVDVAPTLTEMWHHTNIPFYSVGLSRPPLCKHVSAEHLFWIRLRNAVQLSLLSDVMEMGLSDAPLFDIWKRYIKNGVSKELFHDLETFSVGFKSTVMDHKMLPVSRMLIMLVSVLVLQVIDALSFGSRSKLSWHAVIVIVLSAFLMIYLHIFSLEFRFYLLEYQNSVRRLSFIFVIPIYCVAVFHLSKSSSSNTALVSHNLRLISYWLTALSLMAGIYWCRDTPGFDRVLNMEALEAIGTRASPLLTLFLCSPWLYLHGRSLLTQKSFLSLAIFAALLSTLFLYHQSGRNVVLSWIFVGLCFLAYGLGLLRGRLPAQSEALIPLLLLSIFSSIGQSYWYSCIYSNLHYLNLVCLPTVIALPPEYTETAGRRTLMLLRSRLFISWIFLLQGLIMAIKGNSYSVSMNHELLQILEANGEAQRAPFYAFFILMFEKYSEVAINCFAVLPIGMIRIASLAGVQSKSYPLAQGRRLATGVLDQLLRLLAMRYLVDVLVFDWTYVRTIDYEYHIVRLAWDGVSTIVTVLVLVLLQPMRGDCTSYWHLAKGYILPSGKL